MTCWNIITLKYESLHWTVICNTVTLPSPKLCQWATVGTHKTGYYVHLLHCCLNEGVNFDPKYEACLKKDMLIFCAIFETPIVLEEMLKKKKDVISSK